jgi:hypothetical protein
METPVAKRRLVERGRRFLVVLLCAALWAPFASYGSDYDHGAQAFKDGRYTEAFDIWSALAEAGDARAEFAIGNLYFRGLGVERNPQKSIEWYGRSALQGFAPAQFNLGNAYKHGRGVAKNDSLANKWWHKAAEQGVPSAQFNLGMQYYYGRGVAVDKEAAVRWFSEAAKNGHPRAAKMFEAAKPDEPAEKPRELASTQAPAEPISTPSVEAPAPEEKPLDTTATETQPAVSTAPSVVTAEPAEATVALAPTQSLAAPGVAADGNASEWIAAQPGKNFTIQILATQNKKSMDAFINKTPFTETFGWFPFQKDNQTWYALLQGSYGSPAGAKASVQRLPKNIRKNSVWIRRFSAVHAVMGSN